MSLCKFSHSCFCLFCQVNLMLVTSPRRERCEHSSQWLQIFLGSKRRNGITIGLSHSFTPRPPTKNIIDNSETMWASWKLIPLIGKRSNSQLYTDRHHGPEGHDEQDRHHERHHGAAGQQHHHHWGPRAEHEPRRGQGLQDTLQWRNKGEWHDSWLMRLPLNVRFLFWPVLFPGPLIPGSWQGDSVGINITAPAGGGTIDPPLESEYFSWLFLSNEAVMDTLIIFRWARLSANGAGWRVTQTAASRSHSQ